MKGTARPAFALAVVVAAAMAAGGCGRRVLRSSDVSSGDYYTAEEFEHLSEEQRAEYCEDLADEFQYQKERREEASRERTQASGEARSAEERAREIREEIRALESRFPDRRAEEPAAGAHIVRPGETLWRIARRVLGDGRRWKDIHDVNRDRVPDPDRLRVGTELRLPAGAMPENGKGKR